MTNPPVHPDGTIAQVLISLGELKTQVAVVDTKLDNIGVAVSDHEIRIRALERFRWLVVGGSGAVGALAGWIVSYLESFHH